MDNPCARIENGILIQCPKRAVGCAINCSEWREHTEKNQKRYDENLTSLATAPVINFKYINSRRKRTRKQGAEFND